MANNTSAVLDVITENKQITSLKDCGDRSSTCSNSTLAQSPSVGSLSTIQDIENLSELNVDDNSDFCVKVDDPRKHLDTLETYITFRLTTKVARIEFDENEYIVRRRYNDFLWLRQRLIVTHPFCIVPPLPAKHSLIGQLDRYSKDFILERMKALNVFAARLTRHPILSCDENLKIFLTYRRTDFHVYRRQKKPSNPICFPALNGTDSLVPTTHSHFKHRHLEFDQTRTYLNLLVEKLNAIEKISERIGREHIEYVDELNAYHPIFTTAAVTEKNPQLATLLRDIGGAIQRTAVGHNRLARGTQLARALRDFVVYIEVALETLRRRDGYQSQYESSADELARKRNEKDRLMMGGDDTTTAVRLWNRTRTADDRLEELGARIPRLVERVERDQDALECANESLRSDLDYWQTEKRHHLKQMLLAFVEDQIECSRCTVEAWETVVDHSLVGGVPKK